MFYRESKNFLSSESKTFINKVVLHYSFPYFHQYTDNSKRHKRLFLSHIILRRPEQRKPDEGWNSDHHESFIQIVKEFTVQHKIEVKEFLRMCVNFTFNNTYPQSLPHTDHKTDYNQLLLILNEPADTEAATVILSSDRNKIIKKIRPIQYRGICFDSHPHYQIMPRFGHRVAFVATFKLD